MKIGIYACALITSISLSCLAVDYSAKAVKPKNYAGTLEQYYPLEIELKDDETVTVTIVSESKYAEENQKINKLELDSGNRVGRLNYKEIDIQFPMDIELDSKSLKKRYHVSYEINPAGKTVYLKIENGKLAPRVGSTFGSKTPSGLSVKNNVKASDIRQEKVVKLKPTPKKAPANDIKAEPKYPTDRDFAAITDEDLRKAEGKELPDIGIYKDLPKDSQLDSMNVDELKAAYRAYRTAAFRTSSKEIPFIAIMQLELFKIRKLIEKKTGKEFDPKDMRKRYNIF